MARIESPYTIAGTYCNLVVYQVGSNLYARRKSSLTGKRFHKDPAFAKAREKAKQFGKAATIAKEIYAALPKEIKKKGLFGKLTAQVHQGLLAGKDPKTIAQEVLQAYEMGATGLQAQKATSAGALQQPQPLSHWMVTPAGRLQPITPLRQLYRQYRTVQTAVPLLQDG